MAYADFYAVFPADTPATVAPGEAVNLPENGPVDGGIARIGEGTYSLRDAGTYLVQFNALTRNPAQLVLTLNGEDLPYTITAQTDNMNQMTGMALVNVPAGAVLSLRNPDATAFSPVLPAAESFDLLCAHLMVLQLSADSQGQ